MPENIGWVNPMGEGAVPVTGAAAGRRVRNVINNSFGFGGNDSTLIFSK